MHYPLILVWETGKGLGNRLVPICRKRGCCLRQVRDLEECLAALPIGGLAILVLEMTGTDAELGRLAELAEKRPNAAIVVVLMVNDAELARLCWDLGVAYVIEKGRVADDLEDVANGFLKRQWGSREARAHGPTAMAGR